MNKTCLPAPSAYADGYAKARLFDEAAADNYIRHTTIGDPVLDSVLEEVSGLAPAALHRFIEAGVEQQVDVLRSAPQALRDFFDHFEEPPWLDYQAFRPGILVFNENVQLMLVAFVTGVLVEGFSTLIAKSFNTTKRVASTDRRLKQNNRQLMEIFYPGGLRRDGDGWKLSTRVRFVHARIRNLLAKSDAWKHDVWGTPLSAAHLGFAISVFSKRLLTYSALVGAHFSDEEKESVLAVWRYAGYLMGIPETILYTNAEEADTVYRIGYMCEPPPDADSVTMANALIRSIPVVAGITDSVEQKKVITLAYRLSRALLGNTLADQFQYPKGWNIGTLFLFRNKQRVQRFFKRWLKKGGIRSDNFSQMLQISVYDEGGVSYKMPDHVSHSKSSPW